ncbi:MAG: exodeoxyribonuclease VII large subunit [Alphaproteobacteria bacterium TMED87]|nr:exodeoxyribonuclease VII large subunit [Rhodospirillaceae bacterium]OUV10954.1 MAG: exodeoxyribonuclease VII large subunit [Alphaproteobacteria bacterium TMED87]
MLTLTIKFEWFILLCKIYFFNFLVQFNFEYTAMQSNKKDNASEYSVSELSNAIKSQIEEHFGYVRVRGEILQPKIAASGHCYMRLKDENSAIDAIIWRGSMNKLSHQPEEGMEIIASGRITTYPLRSTYQIIIDSFELAGEGALLKLLEDRKKMFLTEGLFEEGLKQDLPLIPEVIGVITSETGAVIKDILHRVKERFPSRIVLWPVSVQGKTASEEISNAIRGFNSLSKNSKIPSPDIIIVARGGGSLEDLWAFNEENVVRAVSKSSIPIISAIGHETDTTLIDYVSDKRAPTPTAAAEMALPVRLDLLDQLKQSELILTRSITQKLLSYKNNIKGLSRGLPKLSFIIDQKQLQLDSFYERISLGPKRLLDHKKNELSHVSSNFEKNNFDVALNVYKEQLNNINKTLTFLNIQNFKMVENNLYNLSKRLISVSPEKVLMRGYAIIKNNNDEVLTDSVSAQKYKNIKIQFKDSEIPVSTVQKKVKHEDKRQKSLL